MQLEIDRLGIMRIPIGLFLTVKAEQTTWYLHLVVPILF